MDCQLSFEGAYLKPLLVRLACRTALPPASAGAYPSWRMDGRSTLSCAPLNRRDELRDNFDLIDKPFDKMARINEGDAAQADSLPQRVGAFAEALMWRLVPEVVGTSIRPTRLLREQIGALTNNLARPALVSAKTPSGSPYWVS
jgi:hypothetical protein